MTQQDSAQPNLAQAKAPVAAPSGTAEEAKGAADQVDEEAEVKQALEDF